MSPQHRKSVPVTGPGSLQHLVSYCPQGASCQQTPSSGSPPFHSSVYPLLSLNVLAFHMGFSPSQHSLHGTNHTLYSFCSPSVCHTRIKAPSRGLGFGSPCSAASRCGKHLVYQVGTTAGEIRPWHLLGLAHGGIHP